jgi:Carboxypeptidase regulatory-like domain
MTRKLHVSMATACVLALFSPASAAAQTGNSGLAGIVRDPSGAVLPGVTVEAASPALIEKVRTVTTGADGSYRILDLRPGVYTVTFSLEGFRSVRREGIELPASFTATVNADLEVGAVAETITVSGAAPLVDVQNTVSQRVMSQAVLDSLPVTSRTPQAFAALMPGVIGQGLSGTPGGREDMSTGSHGASNRESMYLIEGVSTGSAHGEGGTGNYFRISQAYVQEISVTTGGGTAEQMFGGTVTNVIPKEGGNRLTGSVYVDFSRKALTTSNISPELEAWGFTKDSLSNTNKLWDVSPAVGGPILRDKLWFFTSYRDAGVVQSRAGLFSNATPLGWTYTPDLSRPAVARLTDKSRNLRLTWQATPKNKLNAFVDSQPHIVYQRGYQFQVSPEATAYAPFPNFIASTNWKSTLTSHILLDSNLRYNSTDIPQQPQTPKTCDCGSAAVTSDTIAVVDSANGIMSRAESRLGGDGSLGHMNAAGYTYMSSLSYVTGAHNVKTGVRLMQGREWFSWEENQARAYTMKAGVAQSITEYALPIRYQNNIDADLGIFIQDQWTLKHLTINAGVRYDYYDGGAAPVELGAGPFVPARSFPGTKHSPQWKDYSPRLGVSYDLFGDSKTALKATFGRFVAETPSSAGIGGITPVVNSVLTVNRPWGDENNDHIPDCDLRNPQLNGECGRISNLNFGQNNPTANTISPELVHGLRSHNWDGSILVQREIAKGISMTAGFYRNQFYGFTVTDNTLVQPTDYTEYSVTAPRNPQLPDGGGYTIKGLFDVSEALGSRSQNVVTPSTKFGDRVDVYEGFDLTEEARFHNGMSVSGGMNMGRTRSNTCFVVDSPGALRFCDNRPPFQPNFSFITVIPLPWYGFSTSLTYRDYPGYQITATQQYTSAEIKPMLGRDLAAGANATVNVALIEPGTMFGPRQRQLDWRLSKRVRFGSKRISANLDISNLLNANTATAINTTFGPSWLRPTSFQKGRWAKIGAQFDF